MRVGWRACSSVLRTGFFQWFKLLSVHPAVAGGSFDQCDLFWKSRSDAAQSKASLAKKNRSRLDAGRRCVVRRNWNGDMVSSKRRFDCQEGVVASNAGEGKSSLAFLATPSLGNAKKVFWCTFGKNRLWLNWSQIVPGVGRRK
jgi:hypothetical protein